MTFVVVERSFAEPLTDEVLQAFEQREKECLDIYKVVHRRSLLAQDRRRMICEYQAPDAESVRRVQQTTEGPFERIWIAEVIE